MIDRQEAPGRLPLLETSSVLGPDHPDTLQSRNNLTNGYQAVGRSEDADALAPEPTEAP